MSLQKIVHLNCYKPKGGDRRLMYDENGKVTNEFQLMKLVYGGLEWMNNMKNLKALGFFKYDVVAAYSSEMVLINGVKKEVQTPLNIDEIKKEIETAMSVKSDVKLTNDQKRIKELEETLKEVMGMIKPKEINEIEQLKLENQRLKDSILKGEIVNSNEPTINDIFPDSKEVKAKRGPKPKEQ